jgi:uncharacterized protein YfiM (DUF2279 family)
MAVSWHGQFWERGASTGAFAKLGVFAFGCLGDGVWLARPTADGQAFKDIVVDLAGSGTIRGVEVSA